MTGSAGATRELLAGAIFLGTYFARHVALERPLILSAAALALSNLVSNVPAVLLFKSVIPTFVAPREAWLVLAMASTLAGNLTLVGSVANLIARLAVLALR